MWWRRSVYIKNFYLILRTKELYSTDMQSSWYEEDPRSLWCTVLIVQARYAEGVTNGTPIS
jgi:hypothetical protein